MKLNTPSSLSVIDRKKGFPFFMVSVLSITLLFCFGFTMLQPKTNASNEEERYPTIRLGTKIVMPNKMMKGVDGNDYSVLSTIKSNGLLVVFSSNNCPFVLKWED